MNAENERETWLLSAQTYFVPRRTQLVRVAVRDIETARALRTELELLRRIQRCAAQRGVLPAEKNEPDWDQSQRLSDDRCELAEIIGDAFHIVVTDMIELFDQEFPSLRKEISMAVVSEEAENIVAEAVESGATQPECKNPQSTDADTEQTVQPTEAAPVEKDSDQKDATEIGESEPSAVEASDDSAEATVENADPIAALDQALAEAQSVLGDSGMAEPAASGDDGKQTGVDSKAEAMESNQADVTADSQPPDTTPDTGIGEDTDTTADDGATIEQADPQLANQQPTGPNDTSLSTKNDDSQEPTPAEKTVADAPTTTPQYDQQPEPPAAIEREPDVPVQIEAKSEDHMMVDGLPLDCPEQAVNNLEAGIRTLAGQLCLQIDEVSTKTTTSFRELATARTRAGELLSRAENLVDDMTRLRAEAQDARDAAVAAFGEARQLREDTRRAQERADASADSAERAADQARQEAKTAAALARETV